MVKNIKILSIRDGKDLIQHSWVYYRIESWCYADENILVNKRRGEGIINI